MTEKLYRIDDDSLREVVVDEAGITARILELEELGDAGAAERIALLRISDRLDEALALAREEVLRCGGDPDAARVDTESALAGVRLASVLQWRGSFAAADALYRAAIGALSADPLRRAFAEQHLGKSLFDQGRWVEARDRFETALELREEYGASAELIDSSRRAVSAARRRIG